MRHLNAVKDQVKAIALADSAKTDTSIEKVKVEKATASFDGFVG